MEFENSESLNPLGSGPSSWQHMLRQRKKERNEKRRHLVAEDEPAIGFFFFFFFFFPSLSLPVEFYPPWAARVGPTSTVIDLTYARSLSFRTSKEKKPRAYRASKCNDDNRSIIIRLSLFFRFPLKTCIIRDEGFPRREKRKICALVEIFVEIEERRGERAVVEGKGPVEEGQGGGTKGDVFAITCALRYRGGRLERKQCRLSTCTFIRGEPKTNRNPSRGHGYTNALLPGNSIRFRRVWSSVRHEAALPTLRFRTRFKLSFTLFK